MASIFISWGSPDTRTVRSLCDRLRDLGLDLWEYSHDMEAGDQIHGTVMDEINQAQIAIICLSDETAQREWIRTEVAWCFAASNDAGKPMRHIIPVRVGTLSQLNVPHLLRESHLYVFDLSRAGEVEADVQKLAEDVLKKLGKESPLVVPTALFSMTRQQSLELFRTWLATYEENRRRGEAGGLNVEGGNDTLPLLNLCRAVGMVSPPELFEFLRARYGDTPQDLTPFQSGQKLVDTIYRILREVNVARARSGSRHIFFRWVTDELVGPPGERTQKARDLWRSGNSFLIVDSVSTFHPDIQSALSVLPAPVDPSRAALLWVPPYTQHTASLEDSLRITAQVAPHLGDVFMDWENQPRRSVTFDTSTSLALRLWLRRAFAELPDSPPPLQDNVRSMKSSSTGAGVKNLSALLDS